MAEARIVTKWGDIVRNGGQDAGTLSSEPTKDVVMNEAAAGAQPPELSMKSYLSTMAGATASGALSPLTVATIAQLPIVKYAQVLYELRWHSARMGQLAKEFTELPRGLPDNMHPPGVQTRAAARKAAAQRN